MNYRKYITINPKIMTGKPVIAGTRIPVDLILKKLAQNMNIKELLRDYPRLKVEAVRAALEYAGEVSGRRIGGISGGNFSKRK